MRKPRIGKSKQPKLKTYQMVDGELVLISETRPPKIVWTRKPKKRKAKAAR